MSKKRKLSQRRSSARLRKGLDARRHVGFTAEQCRKGYRNSKAKCDDDAATASRFWQMIRGFDRSKRT